MTALLSRRRLDVSATQSVNDLAQVKQIAESAQILAIIAGMSDRLPSGKTTRTRRTPRRRMLLITASD
jgi:hypothetical protein